MDGEKKKVLVAGATGYLGSYVAREFKRRGCFVRALARSPQKLASIRDSLDEVVEAQITRPGTLKDACNGIDIVFSSVGITRQKEGLTFRDVDYQGNKNLLEVAQRAGVKKFIYTSVYRGPSLLHLAIVKAHEDFVTVLETSDMDYTVVRPNGFFSDMGEYLKMAEKGRVYLIGRGGNRINPIHGADLAEVCVNAAEADLREIDVGGPEILTHREIARLAFGSLGKKERISSVPIWMMRALVFLTKALNKHQGELLAFMTEAMSTDAVAPAAGSRTLSEYFHELAVQE
ncbi:MAG: SDR family oxidoreductase [Gemmatimonadota bacterium]|jgi:uncharacterized protein YbjT (DUF2867 family)